jgi:hypothetical protein
VCAGLAHLTRADGILILPVVWLATIPALRRRSIRRNLPLLLADGALLGLGYALVMGPWFARNLSVVGSPLPPGGTKTLWLTTYDDLFCYRCDLSLPSYLEWGWGPILRSKLQALGVNLQRLVAENGLVFLFPFVLVGWYHQRRQRTQQLALLLLGLILLAHSLAFTFPGPRGGFFHASAAVQPFLFAAGVAGLGASIRWLGRRRRWRVAQAQAIFFAAAVVGALALSVYAAGERVPAWRSADEAYLRLEGWLARNAAPEARVMVGNPPGFWYHTRRPAVVLPNGELETLLTVAHRYDVDYVLIDENRPAPLAALYDDTFEHPQLEPMFVWREGEHMTILYRVLDSAQVTPMPRVPRRVPPAHTGCER